MSETKMNPIFSLKNFRSFGETDADFEIAPITILTGCNSSGKSSSVKAQLLLSGLMGKIDQKLSKKLDGSQLWNISLREILSQLVLNISNKQYQLGRFDRVKNDCSDSEYFSLSYKIFSEFLKKNVSVEMVFIGQDGEVINDAILHQITIKIDEIVLVSFDNLEQEYKNTYFSPINDHINYLCLMPSFERFMLFCIGEQAQLEYRSWDFGRSELSKEDVERQIEIAKHWIKDLRLTKEEVDFYRNKYTTNISPSFGATNEYLTKKTLYTWLPFFSETKNMTKQQVRSWLVEEAKSVSSEENIQPIQWVNFFCDDFDASECLTLTDYFLSLEKEALQNGDIDEARSFSLPYVGVIVDKTIDVSSLFGDAPTSEKKSSIEEKPSPRRIYEDNRSFRQIMNILDYIFLGPESFSPFSKSNEFPNNYQVETRLKAFARAVIFETLVPDFLSDAKYVSSSSTIVRRLYDLNENDKIANSIVKLLDGEKQGFVGIDRTKEVVFRENENLKYVPKTFLNKWCGCDKFDIGNITIEGTDQGLGAFIYVEKNGRKRLMADEGYGITQLFSLILQIECCILNATRRQKLTGEWTYYGGNYSVEYEPQYICVEEPEIHLHPKFQSLLADMFVEAYQEYKIHFIIETHSEYLIRKLQVMVADKENQLSPNDISINYIDKDDTGTSHNRQIKILDDGSLDGKFGTGFFDQAASLAVTLFKSKNVLS